MDLAEIIIDNNEGGDKHILNVINIFDRKLYSEPLETKSPVEVMNAVKK